MPYLSFKGSHRRLPEQTSAICSMSALASETSAKRAQKMASFCEYLPFTDASGFYTRSLDAT